jgi:DNA-binding transcriptional LysR family regulator
MIDYLYPETSRPFVWEFRKGRKEITVEPRSQLMLTDVATMHAVCLAGYGIAQILELSVETHLSSGRLVILFQDWEEERFPLYAYYPSRQYLAPKTRAFLEFVSTTVQASQSCKTIPG